jgi:Ca-activated chloride channel homolog
MFERPMLLWLLLAAPLVVAPGAMAMVRGKRLFGGLSVALRLVAFLVLVFMLAGLRLPARTPAHRLAVIVAMDESRSIAPDQAAWMRGRVAALRRAMDPNDRIAVIGFGRNTALLDPMGPPRMLAGTNHFEVDDGGTDIAGALTTAAGLFPAGSEKHLLLLSDGNQTRGDGTAEIPALVEEGVRVWTAAPPGSATNRIAISDFQSPPTVRARTSFALRLDVESEARQPVEVRIRLASDGAPLGSEKVTLRPGLNRFELPYRIDREGAHVLSADLDVPPRLAAANSHAETTASVVGPPHILLVAAGPPESLIAALKLRQYQVDQASPRGLPRQASGYLPYQVVIIANVPARALGADVQRALNRYVADLGGGLIVTGDTLRDGGYHGSDLEKTLPILFRPQPPPPSREPIAIYLLIDRSNSMSYDSRYPALRDGERIRYAKDSAIALLRQLDDTDYAGVIAFDSEPYVLGHLRPIGEDRQELINRIERLEPGGGTDFLEALEIAEREILTSGIPVRQVILLTDGDTNRQYHDHDAIMASYAKQEIPVSTIRIGPDLANLTLLQDFAKETGGVFYRVGDIRKLPQLLVRLTRRAQDYKRHVRTNIEYGSASAILNGISPADIPPIGYFATTAAKEGAVVPLTVRHGRKSSPLLAAWQYGLGRSAVFAAGPDSMASVNWIRWDRYAEFWSQLVTWVMRQGDSGPFTLRVRATSDGLLRITAEKEDSTPVNGFVCRITGPGHALDIPMTQMGASLYRGESVPLPRGKYNVALMLKTADTEKVLLRREVAVTAPASTDAAELSIRPPNLDLLRRLAVGTGGQFGEASPVGLVKHSGALVIVYRNPEPYLLPLALLLILGEVFIRRRFLGD